MGLHCDFFALNEAEFQRVLRGWKHPNPPVEQERELRAVNPFTGEAITIRTRANPLQPEADPDAVDAPKLTRRKNVVSWKWITEFELAEMVAAFQVSPSVNEATDLVQYNQLIGPVSAYGGVHEVPTQLVERLANSDEQSLQAAAVRWTSLRGEEAFPPWTVEDLTELLQNLRALAHKAQHAGQRVYLHYGEP